MITNRFWNAVERKGWSDNIEGVYDDYNGRASDSRIIVVNLYNTNQDKLEKFLEKVCEADGNLEWNYSDSVRIDFDDNCAYNIGYDEPDVIMAECEYIGRRRFEEGEMSFDDVVDMFVNNPTMALPSWLDPTDGWEQRSCDFEAGWYGRNDSPDEIQEALDEKDLDVVFQIDYVNPFATGFCVWTKERV